MSDIFDFGFTLTTLGELEELQEKDKQIQEVSGAAETLQTRIDDLYEAFLPLLANLKKDPSRDYIYWPNRLDKIEEFESVLHKIYTGK